MDQAGYFSAAQALEVGYSYQSQKYQDRDGYQITSAKRTLFDVATSTDMTQEQLDVAVADAVKEEIVVPRELRDRVDEFGTRAALRIERALTALASET
jgi:hypothetical protein